MDNQLFLEEFENASLKDFSHAKHIRMAWLYLYRDGWDIGYPNIRAGLKHFALKLNVSDKYHETVTGFWARLVLHCIDERPDIDNFEQFQEAFPFLFTGDIMKKHYSDDVLWSDMARKEWVAPDKVPMP
ncbi:MAG: hypothetical protein Phog2KO_06930 [Phototrophicaceae bacterium]